MRYTTVLATLPLAFAAPLTARDGPTKYIVVLKAGSPAPQQAPAGGHVSNGPSAAAMPGNAISHVQKEHVYDQQGFKGFSAALTESQIEALRQDSSVSGLHLASYW
jgi:hypothetical protein